MKREEITRTHYIIGWRDMPWFDIHLIENLRTRSSVNSYKAIRKWKSVKNGEPHTCSKTEKKIQTINAGEQKKYNTKNSVSREEVRLVRRQERETANRRNVRVSLDFVYFILDPHPRRLPPFAVTAHSMPSSSTTEMLNVHDMYRYKRMKLIQNLWADDGWDELILPLTHICAMHTLHEPLMPGPKRYTFDDDKIL